MNPWLSDGVPRACISVDLDSLRCYGQIHGLDPAHMGAASSDDEDWEDAAYTIGVARLLELLDAAGVKATLFVIGQDVRSRAHRRLLQEAAQAGHELANHSYSHYYDLRSRGLNVQEAELARAEEQIFEVCGRRPLGFRAPGYNISPELLRLCTRRGYLYDASIFPCPPYYAAKGAVMTWLSLRGRPSSSAMVRPETLLAPLQPYFPDEQNMWRRSARTDGLLEIPVAVIPGIRFPVIGTSLHMLSKRGFDMAFPLLRRAYDRVFNLEFHAIDFMDANDPGVERLVGIQPDLSVPWAVKRARYVHVFQRLRDFYRFATMEQAARLLKPALHLA